MKLEDIFTYDNLNNAFYSVKKSSSWKTSTIRYQANMLINNLDLMEEVLNKTYRVSKTNDFYLSERGKVRYIQAPIIKDRIVQKVLCTHVLIPQIRKYLIYDNYASLEHRGTSLARKRIDIFLRRYISQYGSDGYILKIDIKKYFESIDHNIIKSMLRDKLKVSKDVLELINHIIDSSSDTDKGLNLGSEVPQILATFYLSRVDNYIKTVKRIKYYGRYMDDMFILSNNKQELKTLLEEVRYILNTELGLDINDRKTSIIKLSKGFSLLQVKYNIVGNRLIKRPTRAKIVRERRKLKKYKYKFDTNKMGREDIYNYNKSWRNNLLKDCNKSTFTIDITDRLFQYLFGNIKPKYKVQRDELIRKYFKEEQLNEIYSTR